MTKPDGPVLTSRTVGASARLVRGALQSQVAIAKHAHHELSLDDIGCPRCGLDGPGEPEAFACSRCATVGAGRYCSKCGAELEQGHVVRRAARALFGPLFEYFEHIRWLIRPRELAHEIRDGHFTGVELIGFWVAAVLVASLIEAFLPVAEGEHFELPIVLEAAQALLLMVRTVIVFAPAHLLLRIGHRDVTVRQFLLTILTVAALLYPWLKLVQGVIVHRLPGEPTWWTMPFSIAFYSAAFAALYRRRIWTALPIFGGYVMALVALLAGLAVLAAQTAHKPSPPQSPPVTAKKS
ncbi:hypothetical protein [Sphingomonas bacterium]|uniref:hypothetical protein n=1 Tax=Sphingomonas bacterium TaxID=1895847 RepID=UPI002620AEE0|nr:hypothetical protein [Sphingomonas bacterium]MDB5677328.1 hypothetical protein [Sphingomonas bacterium]